MEEHIKKELEAGVQCLLEMKKLHIFTLNVNREPKFHLIPRLAANAITIGFFRKKLHPFFARNNRNIDPSRPKEDPRRYFDLAVLLICCHHVTLIEDRSNDHHISMEELKSAASQSADPKICRFILRFEELRNSIPPECSCDDSESCNNCERITRSQNHAKDLVSQLFGKPDEIEELGIEEFNSLKKHTFLVLN